jgi:hypothetical protein
MSMSTIFLSVIACVLFGLYIARRRARLSSEE